MGKAYLGRGLPGHAIRFDIDARRHLPLVKGEVRARRQNDRDLSALGTEPQAFLATEDVNVLLQGSFPLSRWLDALADQRTVNPAKADAAG